MEPPRPIPVRRHPCEHEEDTDCHADEPHVHNPDLTAFGGSGVSAAFGGSGVSDSGPLLTTPAYEVRAKSDGDGKVDDRSHRDRQLAPPNGSRLSCGRRVRGRKALERQIKRLASEATQFLPTCERPAASSAG